VPPEEEPLLEQPHDAAKAPAVKTAAKR